MVWGLQVFFFFPKLRCLVILKYPLAFYRCCPWQALGSHPGTSGHLCTGPSGKMDQVLSFCHFAVFIGTPLPQATPVNLRHIFATAPGAKYHKRAVKTHRRKTPCVFMNTDHSRSKNLQRVLHFFINRNGTETNGRSFRAPSCS